MFSSALACPTGHSAAALAVDAVSARDFAGLPAPVRAYLRRAIQVGATPPSSIMLEQTGELRVGRWWRPFTATEELKVPPAAFTWDARVRMAPLLTARVRDTYERGVGTVHASVAGLFTMADAHGGATLNAAALHRYLAECVWLPAALLPRYALEWSPIDENRALATLSDAGNRVSLEFTFNDRAEVAQVFTPARGRAVDGGFQPTPWRVLMTRYDERLGFRIPVEAEVSWEIDGAWQPCWRGRVGRVHAVQETGRPGESNLIGALVS
jgi:hypothetical protein